MKEKVFIIESVEPMAFYGVNNENLQIIKSYYKDLQIVARGNELKVLGKAADIAKFEQSFVLLIEFIEKYTSLNVDAIDEICGKQNSEYIRTKKPHDSIILYGNDGQVIKPQTQTQLKLVENIERNDLVFAVGPAGTGKTYIAVAMAVQALKNKEVKRIVLTRPAVEAGENLGFLPGDLNEKLAPYLQPLYDAMRSMIPPEKLKHYNETGVIEIAPLAYMRGRTLDKAFVILDEAQNATSNQMKMFLTRMGKSAKFVVTGDITQIDLPRTQRSGLQEALKILQHIKGIEFVHFSEKDVVRHPLVKKILNAYKD